MVAANPRPPKPRDELLHEVKVLDNREDLYGPQGTLSNAVALAGERVAEGRFAVCGTPSGQLVLVDCLHGVVAYQGAAHQGPIHSVDALSHSQVVSGGQDGCLCLCDFSEEVGEEIGLADAAKALQETAMLSEQAFFSLAVKYEDTLWRKAL